jgi:sugar/nucleoside kinase (ribokinase family)
MKKVIGTGNALVDILIRLENDGLLSELNLQKGSMQLVDKDFKNAIHEKTKHLNKSQASGGSAANTIHGLASLGVETAFIGTVGNDETGKFFMSDLNSVKIKPILKISTSETGVATTLISRDSERTFGTFLGAAVEVGPEDITPSVFKGYDIFHIEGYLVFNQPLVEKAVKVAKQEGLIVTLDLASFNVVEANLAFLRDITSKYIDIVFANEEEAKAFTGKTPEDALDEIAGMCKIAVVKVGKNGSFIKSGAEKVHVNAIPAKVIDTTGAGDLFAAGFLYGYANNLSLEKCAEIGSILAGNVIEVVGAKISPDTWTNIRRETAKIMHS